MSQKSIAASVAAMLAAGQISAAQAGTLAPPKIVRAQPTHLFAEITRKDAATREVEGYCYVNAKCGDGWNLKRKAMEAASDDYMKFGAIREMHGSNAAGTAQSITWDDKGCLIRARIVDDAAWRKVDEGVYKGFSVGVTPQVVRGSDVETCKWVENSLVDRPFDDDATFTQIARALGASEKSLAEEYDVTVLPEGAPRPDGKLLRSVTDVEEMLTELEAADGDALAALVTRLKMGKIKKAVRKIAKVKSALQSGGLYYAAQPTVTRREAETPKGPASMSTPDPALIARAETAENSLRTAQADAAKLKADNDSLAKRVNKIERQAKKDQKKAKKEIQRLSGLPAATQRPVQFPEAGLRTGPLARSFAANQDGAEGDAEAVKALTARRSELEALAGDPDTHKRMEAAVEIQSVEAQLMQLGAL